MIRLYLLIMKLAIKKEPRLLLTVRKLECVLSASVIFSLLFLLPILSVKKTYGFIREDRMNYTVMHCDRENLLWIGTQNGLYLWQSPSRIRIQNTININITALSDYNNLLFIGADNGSLYCYNKTERYLTRLGKLPKTISALSWQKNTLNIGTKGDGIFQVTLSSIGKIKTIESLGQERNIYEMRTSDDGDLWVASEKGLICHKLESGIPVFQYDNEAVNCVNQRGNRIAFGTQSGKIIIGHLSKSNTPILDTLYAGPYKIKDILLTNRFVFIATESGMMKVNGAGQTEFIGPDNRSMEFIEIDLEGNVWAIGRHLLMQLRGEQIELISELNHNKIGNIRSICRTSSDEVILGTDDGVLKKLNNKTISKIITLPADVSNRNILWQDSKGRIWTSTLQNQLIFYHQGRIHKIPLTNKSSKTEINQIIEWSNKIWIATNSGAYYCSVEDSLFHFKELLSSSLRKKISVNQILEDTQKRVWFATEGEGIYRWNQNKIINLSNRLGIKSSVFESITADKLGNIWLSAFQNGLYCIRGDSVIHLTTDNGLASNNILSICAYQQNYLVAASAVGIDLIETGSLLTVHYNFEDLRLRCNPNINVIIANKKNDLFIGTQQGLLNYYLPNYRTLFTPEVFIDEIRANGQSISKKKNVFEPQTEFFRFIFRTRWNSEDEIYYRYKLIGLSDNWVTTAEKEITFAGLTSGKYTLLISVSNNRNFLNEKQIRYDFEILSPFYKQLWFLIVIVILLLSTIVFIIRYREVRYSRLQILEKEMLMTEFQALKNQVSPHFLFNSFNTLIQVIDEDKNKGIEYAQMLSDFYRSLLSYRDKDTVEISEEFRVLNQYIYLQKMRFGESLIYKNRCLANRIPIGFIPPLTLQLLAENAVKHNQISTTKPLTLFVYEEDDYLVIRNNINFKINNEIGEHIGLQNIKNRFRLLTKREVKIIHNQDNFEVRIPILKTK
jgi:ligand-binding sensor domain-containing protein